MMSFARLPLLALAASLAVAGCTTMDDDSASMSASNSSDSMASSSTSGSSASSSSTQASASTSANPMVGGSEMFPNRTIAANASTASNLTTLVAAVQAAGLVETLNGPGPFTVFAPTNDAFSRLAPGTVDTLLKPENKASLTKVLTFHVVPGTLDAAALTRQITAGGGTATLTTVAGETLKLTAANNTIAITDSNGTVSYVEQADVRQSNGVVHVINGVLVPKLG